MARAASEVVLEGECSEAPPEWVNPMVGKCKYPFAELEVGHAFRVVGRPISTIRSAMRRWIAQDKARRARKFQVWKARDPSGRACVRVKRAK